VGAGATAIRNVGGLAGSRSENAGALDVTVLVLLVNFRQACVTATASDRDDVLQELYGMTETQVRLVYHAIGTAMFQAVRLGGGPCTGLPWRWGYGYPHCWGIGGD
jgi:hypothetical protein